MELRQLHFTQECRNRNLTEAAFIFITQSTLSQQIKQLENDPGACFSTEWASISDSPKQVKAFCLLPDKRLTMPNGKEML